MASTVLSVHCNSVTGWDCTYFLLAWLSRSHELQHYTHPSPATNMLRKWQKKMETDRGRGGRRQKAWGPLSFFSQLCCFNSSRLSPERKAGQKVGCAGKVRISLGGDVQQQLRPGLSPALAQPPLRIVLHTCQYIHSGHKAFTISGPLRIPMPGAEHRNKKYAHPPWLGAACSVHYYSYMCVCMLCICRCMLVSLQMCVCAFSILSLPWHHFETLQVLRSASLGISFSPQQHRGTKWLMDRWLAGWDEGRRGNRGMSYKLRGIIHACIHNADKHTTQGEDDGRAEGRTQRKTP